MTLLSTLAALFVGALGKRVAAGGGKKKGTSPPREPDYVLFFRNSFVTCPEDCFVREAGGQPGGIGGLGTRHIIPNVNLYSDLAGTHEIGSVNGICTLVNENEPLLFFCTSQWTLDGMGVIGAMGNFLDDPNQEPDVAMIVGGYGYGDSDYTAGGASSGYMVNIMEANDMIKVLVYLN